MTLFLPVCHAQSHGKRRGQRCSAAPAGRRGSASSTRITAKTRPERQVSREGLPQHVSQRSLGTAKQQGGCKRSRNTSFRRSLQRSARALPHARGGSCAPHCSCDYSAITQRRACKAGVQAAELPRMMMHLGRSNLSYFVWPPTRGSVLSCSTGRPGCVVKGEHLAAGAPPRADQGPTSDGARARGPQVCTFSTQPA